MKNNYVKKMSIALFIILIVLLIISSLYIILSPSKNKSKTENSLADYSSSEDNSSLSDDGNKEDKMYDTTPISDAYKSGDKSGLDEKQKRTLELAEGIIENNISQSMTDYEKELTIHDYIVLNATYDTAHLSAISAEDGDSATPYGTLENGVAICKGYTSTFQMFMDMLDINCKIIFAGDKDGGEHAWNMVEIDGKWYYVDVTWDDPIADYNNRPVRHTYFNVTQELMEVAHEWDTTDLPDADSYEYSYLEQSLTKVESTDEILPLMEKAVADMQGSIVLDIPDSFGIDMTKAGGPDDYCRISYKSGEIYYVIEDFKSNHQDFAVNCQVMRDADKNVLVINLNKTKD